MMQQNTVLGPQFRIILTIRSMKNAHNKFPLNLLTGFVKPKAQNPKIIYLPFVFMKTEKRQTLKLETLEPESV